MCDVQMSVKVDLFVTIRQNSLLNYLVRMVEKTENLRLVFQSSQKRITLSIYCHLLSTTLFGERLGMKVSLLRPLQVDTKLTLR